MKFPASHDKRFVSSQTKASVGTSEEPGYRTKSAMNEMNLKIIILRIFEYLEEVNIDDIDISNNTSQLGEFIEIIQPQGNGFSFDIKHKIVLENLNLGEFVESLSAKFSGGLEKFKALMNKLGEIGEIFFPSDQEFSIQMEVINLSVVSIAIGMIDEGCYRHVDGCPKCNIQRYVVNACIFKSFTNFINSMGRLLFEEGFIDKVVEAQYKHFDRIFDLIHYLTRYFFNQDLREEEVLPQGNYNDDNHFNILVELFEEFTGYKARSAFPSLLRNVMTYSGKKLRTIKELVAYITTTIGDFLRKIYGKDNFFEYFMVAGVDEDVLDMYNKSNKLASEIRRDPYSTDVYYSELNYLRKNILSKSKNIEKGSAHSRVIDICMRILHEAENYLREANVTRGKHRVEPVGIILVGSPGVGKSVLMDRLVKLTNEITVPSIWLDECRSEPDKFIFQFPTDKFWDTYNNKCWTVKVDDIFQKRDTANTENSEPLNIIKMINTEPYLLQMANVTEKNTVFFESKFVFATSNMADFSRLESINSYSAVERRFHLKLHIRLNPKYEREKGKIDKDKLPIEEIATFNKLSTMPDIILGTSYPDDLWIIEREISKEMFEIMSIEEVLLFIKNKHKEHCTNYQINSYSSIRAHRDLINKLRDNHVHPQSSLLQGWFGGNISYDDDNIVSCVENFEECESEESCSNYEDIPPGLQNFSSLYDALPSSEVRKFTNGISYIFNKVGYGLYSKDPLKYFEAFYNSLDNEAKIFVCTRIMTFKPSDLDELSTLLMEYLEKGYSFNTTGRGITFEMLVLPAFYAAGVNIKDRTDAGQKYSVFMRVLKNYLANLATSFLFGTVICYVSKIIRKTVVWIYTYLTSDDGSNQKSKDEKIYGLSKHHFNGTRNEKKDQDSYVVHSSQDGIYESQADLNKDIELPNFRASDLGHNSHTTDILVKTHNKYFYILYINYNIGSGFKCKKMGHSVNILGQYYAIPCHFLYEIDALRTAHPTLTGELIFSSPTKKKKYRISLSDVFSQNLIRSSTASLDNDVVLLKLPQAHMTSVGIFPHLLKECDLAKLRLSSNFHINTLTSGFDDADIPAVYVKNNYTTARLRKEPVVVKASWPDTLEHYALNETIMYHGNFAKGDCGSLVFYNATTFENRNILGIHVAGTERTGFAVLLTQEMVVSLIDKDEIFYFEEESPKEVYEHIAVIEPQGGVVPTGKVAPAPTACLSSSLRKSEIYEHIRKLYPEANYKPARLTAFVRNGEIIDPSYNSYLNYGKDPGCVQIYVVNVATDMYKNNLYNLGNVDNRYPRVLQAREALKSYGFMSPIKSSTSSGYPANAGYRDIKKEYAMALEEGDTIKEELLIAEITSEANIIITKMLSGKRPMFLYTDNLKDEKREYQKVLEGKTRLFSGSPFYLLLLFRMYFGDFMNFYYEGRIYNGSAIGVNPYGTDWDNMARWLLGNQTFNCKKIFGAGDYSKFDGSEQPLILNNVYDIIETFYATRSKDVNYKDAKNIRKKLWLEITNSRHVFQANYYEWHASMPSGNPMTALINTMYNNLALRCCYVLSGNNIREFDNYVRMVALGDDIVYTAHPKIHDTFNEILMPGYMSVLGLKYTTETKGEATQSFRYISEVEFLKRSFVIDKALNRWIAPKRLESLFPSLLWTKKGQLSTEISVSNIFDYAKELSLHDLDTFDKYLQPVLSLKEIYYSNYPYPRYFPKEHRALRLLTLNEDYSDYAKW